MHNNTRHFLQIPGPTNVPDSVLRAVSQPTIDHRGPRFGELFRTVRDGMRPIFRTEQDVVIYPSTGTGAWEAGLVNTLSPGDRILFFETGHFATLWQEMATKLGLRVTFISGDWRHGVAPEAVQAELEADTNHEYKAVGIVHNETSTGVTSRIPEIRKAIDAANHPALLMVDTISSLGSIDYRHDEWGVDVTIAGSQKGLMLPPGLGFNAISAKALSAYEDSTFPKSVWDWGPMLTQGKRGYTPYTPSTNLLFGLQEAQRLLAEEGLENIFHRHDRHGEATRAAVRAWGLEVLCLNEQEYSSSLTAVLVPDEFNADDIRAIILERFNMSLGAGLTKMAGKVFRIGHLGELSDLTLAGTLAGVQMGLELTGVPVAGDGVAAALEHLKRE